MSEKVTLRLLECPTCGANLKVDDHTETVDCVYCGNTFAPFFDRGNDEYKRLSEGVKGAIRVEGIKTPSSALAYLDIFFKEYDWESFSLAQSLTVAEIDVLADQLKSTSTDDKNTWLVCFKAISVPLMQKIKGCQTLLSSIVEAYRNDDFDAYSKFDAYKRVVASVSECKDEKLTKLKEIQGYAVKYGASLAETNAMHSEISAIESAVPTLTVYENIHDVAEVQQIDLERNAEIASRLASHGIYAEREYARAKELLARKEYAEALTVLLPLKGYADTSELIDKIDKLYFIQGVLEIEGVLYYLQQAEGSDTSALYPVKDGKIAPSPIITGVSRIITNYADILYYVTAGGILTRYCLSTGIAEKLYKKSVDVKKSLTYQHRAFLWAKKADSSGIPTATGDLISVELSTGKVSVVLENVKKIVSLDGSKIVCKMQQSIDRHSSRTVTVTSVLDVDTMALTDLGTEELFVEGFTDSSVIYTQYSPNEHNKDLYIKTMCSEESAQLLEKNIYRFCKVIAGKIFYYIGNAGNKTLIHVNCDGTGRKEWPLYISEVLFEQGGWLYYVRKSGYNAVLCKSHMDGTDVCMIANDIDRFVQIKNGYLYYINDLSSLVKVRMDGSGAQTLCTKVETVLSVQEDKVVFVSIDGKEKIRSAYDETVTTKVVKSIYAVRFNGDGKIKLAYDVKEAGYYDDRTVYYVVIEETADPKTQTTSDVKVLYKLDVPTDKAEKLLELQIAEKGGLSGFKIAMIVTLISTFFAIIGGAAEVPGLVFLGIFAGVISLIIGIVLRFSKDD